MVRLYTGVADEGGKLGKLGFLFFFFGWRAGREVHGMIYDDYILGQVGLGV